MKRIMHIVDNNVPVDDATSKQSSVTKFTHGKSLNHSYIFETNKKGNQSPHKNTIT